MKFHSSFRWVLMSVVCLVGPSFAQKNGTSLSLQDLIDEALDRNPEIKATERRWRASQARPSVVSALPDPMFSYARFGSSVETRVGPQENVLSLSQRIPFPGKLGLMGRVANQEALTEQHNYEATKRDVIYEIKLIYYDLYWIDQSVVILDQYLSLLNDFTRVAEQKYATGQGIQANVLQSQVEISTVMERRLGFEKLRHGKAARINALWDRPQDTEIPQASDMDSTRQTYDEARLVTMALSQRQELQAVQARVDKSKFMRRLAKKDYFPDFNLQANYIDISRGVSTAPDAGKNAWSIMVGLNLPIWLGKRSAGVREADELLVSNQMSYENLENQIRSEIRDVCYQLQVTDQTLKLYEQALLTQAQSSFESTLASYQTGKLDFLNLLDAERMLLNLNLSYIKEQANYRKRLATLERAVGGDLSPF
ncbi:TolC family protein [bacterium]|nr:TolC family protein [bacterium]